MILESERKNLKNSPLNDMSREDLMGVAIARDAHYRTDPKQIQQYIKDQQKKQQHLEHTVDKILTQRGEEPIYNIKNDSDRVNNKIIRGEIDKSLFGSVEEQKTSYLHKDTMNQNYGFGLNINSQMQNATKQFMKKPRKQSRSNDYSLDYDIFSF